jgi:DNA-directed RNA polymerase subunit N (RpoN/RPB10)
MIRKAGEFMSVKIDKELAALINAPETLKVLATIDKNGEPHVVYKGSIHAEDNGNLSFLELLESSRSSQNLVHSIWFDKKIAVNVLDKDKNSYEIIAKPTRCITCGREFERAYESVRDRLGDVDLSAIWIVEPVKITNETYRVRLRQEEENFPIIRHLDRSVG